MRTATPSLNRLLLPVTLALFVVGHSRASFADKICVKTALKRGKVTLTSSTVASNQSCPRGTAQLVDTATLTGPQGLQGPAGADGTNGSNGSNGSSGVDGSIRIYGDGSAGTISVVADTTLSDPNKQYEDLFINSGVTLTVPSGTVIRSTGTVTINGTLRVSTGGIGGQIDSGNVAAGFPQFSVLPATQGHAKSPAGAPEIGSNADLVYGGLAGRALTSFEARSILKLSSFGCGSGTGSLNKGSAGAGGGSLTILAKTGIVISGTGSISANGGSGAVGNGGGAGGFVILASNGSITNSGSISATGGSGGPSTTDAAAGGGGGGGIVHILAPSMSLSGGTVTLTQGSVGSTATAVSSNARRSGGGAGGGCGGRGADGNSVLATNSQTQGSAAQVGQLLTTVTDPVSLF